MTIEKLTQNSEYIQKHTKQELLNLCVKVNIPFNMKGYNNGNGEGCWALPLTENDFNIINKGVSNEKAFVVLCNSSIYCSNLKWSTVIQVNIVTGKRPILDIHWLHQILKNHDINYLKLLQNKDSLRD